MSSHKRTKSGFSRDEKQSSQSRMESVSHSSHDAFGQIYGVIPVLEALRSDHTRFDQISIAEGVRHERLRDLIDLANQKKVPVRRVPRVALDRMLPGAVHQGIVARTAAATYREADELLEQLSQQIANGEGPLVLGLDAIEDPRNFGAILRTAECAGVGAVFIPERRAVGLTATVAKAAAGALEHVSVARVTNLVQLIDQLKKRNIWVVGATSEGSSEYTQWDWSVPSALFLGGEGKGLHRLVRERCDALVRIPLRGHIESLNVSVAAGVILYEALRQRTVKKQP